MDRSGGDPNKPSNFEMLIQTNIPIEVSFVFLDGAEEELALVSCSVEEAVDGSEATVESLDLLDSGKDFISNIADIWSGLAWIPR